MSTAAPTHHDDSADALFQSTFGPVKLAYEGANTATRDDTGDVFNDFGFVVRAKADTGEDVYLWTFSYRQQGDELIIDNDVTQTLLLYGTFSDEQKKQMHDIRFINKGQNLEDYATPGSLKITENDREVTWTLNGREFVAAPPEWRIRGTHAGVTANIRVFDPKPAFFHTGEFENLGDDGSAGYIMHTRAEGEIQVDGRTLTISGFAVHERILSIGTVPPRMNYMGGRGLNWIHAWSEEFSFYIMAGDTGPMAVGMIAVDGTILSSHDPAEAWVEEIGHWLDPKSNQLSPCKWRVSIRTDEGVLEATVTAYGRGYYPWIRRGGNIVVNQYIADAISTFTYPDGRVLRAEQMAGIEQMRTFYRQPE